jgi:predicted outer membrane repeat protein
VLQILGNLLLATNTDAVWTNRPDGLGGMLKFVSRCDTALTANGVTFTPPGLANVPGQYGTGQLGPDDVLEIPKSTRRSPTDCLNSFPIEFVDRTQDYRLTTVDEPAMDDVDQRGLLRASKTTLSGIVLAPGSATMLSRIWAQRSLKVRNTWTLKLSFRHMLLEPTDVITYRDDVIGRTTTLRVVAVDEQNMDGSITFTCEEWSSAGIHVAAQVTPQGQSDAAYKPAQGTAIATAVLQPQVVPQQGLVAAALTVSPGVTNAFPNHNSESSPPAQADISTPEWAGRVASATAYSGSYVRQLSAALNGAQILGDNYVAGGAADDPSYRSRLGIILPANPGEQFNISALARFTQASNGDVLGARFTFLDNNKKTLAGGGIYTTTLTTYAGAGLPTAWSPVSYTTSGNTSAVAPAGTAYVYVYQYADSNFGAVTAQFDSLYVCQQLRAGSYGAQSIQGGDIANLAVGTSNLADLNVTTVKIANGAVDSTKLASGAVDSTKMSSLSWANLTLVNSWANTAGRFALGWVKDQVGFVHLRGKPDGTGASNDAMTTLPAGSRPSNTVEFNGAGGNNITIDTAGVIRAPAGFVYCLDGLSFDTR